MVQPGQADIGKAINLAVDFFADGIGQLIIELNTKRGVEGFGAPLGGYAAKVRQARPPTAPEGVPQQEYDRCFTDITGVLVTATSPGAGCVQFDNVPASCMNLATVLVGDPVNGPYPTPCGSACLVYNNLSNQQFNDLVSTLKSVGA